MSEPRAEARAAEIGLRLAQLRSVLDRGGQSAALLRTRTNFAWLTAGGSGHVLQSSETAIAAILVTRDNAVAITHNIEADRLAEEELAGTGIELVAVPWWEPDAIESEAATRLPQGSRPATDDDLEPDLVSIRSVLSAFDRKRLATLGEFAQEGVDRAISTAAPGTTEEDLAAETLGRLRGVRVPVLLVAADDRILRHRHPLPGTTSMRRRVMLVVVAERHGLHVAITRLRELEPPPPNLARRREAVAEVHAAMNEATRAGSTFGAVFEAARTAYAAAGFPDEWRHHHQGGSIGYRARERVAIPGDETTIQVGMAFAWNPSIAGAKAEATIILEGDGGASPITTG